MEATDLVERKRAWNLLSDLFLDSDFAEQCYKSIGAQLAKTSFAVSELEYILKYEVAPVVGGNLLSPAGIWDGFDQEWLETEIQKHIKENEELPISGSIFCVRRVWKKIKNEINEQRNTNK